MQNQKPNHLTLQRRIQKAHQQNKHRIKGQSRDRSVSFLATGLVAVKEQEDQQETLTFKNRKAVEKEAQSAMVNRILRFFLKQSPYTSSR